MARPAHRLTTPDQANLEETLRSVFPNADAARLTDELLAPTTNSIRLVGIINDGGQVIYLLDNSELAVRYSLTDEGLDTETPVEIHPDIRCIDDVIRAVGRCSFDWLVVDDPA